MIATILEKRKKNVMNGFMGTCCSPLVRSIGIAVVGSSTRPNSSALQWTPFGALRFAAGDFLVNQAIILS